MIDRKTMERSEQIVIPDEFQSVQDVPGDIKQAIRERETRSPCGVTASVNWTSGPWKGLPFTTFCAEPNCLINGGTCTGPRFIPHLDQYTSSDLEASTTRRRVWTAEEGMAAVEQATKRAEAITKVKDRRTMNERRAYIGTWLKRMLRDIRNTKPGSYGF